MQGEFFSPLHTGRIGSEWCSFLPFSLLIDGLGDFSTPPLESVWFTPNFFLGLFRNSFRSAVVLPNNSEPPCHAVSRFFFRSAAAPSPLSKIPFHRLSDKLEDAGFFSRNQAQHPCAPHLPRFSLPRWSAESSCPSGDVIDDFSRSTDHGLP